MAISLFIVIMERIIIPGAISYYKLISNTTMVCNLRNYMIQYLKDILEETIFLQLVVTISTLSYHDNYILFNYLFNGNISRQVDVDNYYKNIFDNIRMKNAIFIEKMKNINLLNDNIELGILLKLKKLELNKYDLTEIMKHNISKLYCNETNDFLFYLINHIDIYYYNDNSDNRNLIIVIKSKVEYIEKEYYIEFTYEQFACNLYKIKLCLLSKSNYIDYYYQILSLYKDYINFNKTNHNFILICENKELKIYNLIESKGLWNNNFNLSNVKNSLIKYKSSYLYSLIKVYNETIIGNIKKIKETKNNIRGKKGGSNESLMSNNRENFFKNILYNFNNNNDNNDNNKFLNFLNIKQKLESNKNYKNLHNKKCYGLIININIINNLDNLDKDKNKYPSINIIFFNQVNKGLFEIDTLINEQQKILQNTNNYNISNELLQKRQQYNNEQENNEASTTINKSTTELYSIIYENIYFEKNKLFLYEIITNLKLENYLNYFNIYLYEPLNVEYDDKNKQNEQNKKIYNMNSITKELLDINYFYNIFININIVDNNIIIKYKEQIDIQNIITYINKKKSDSKYSNYHNFNEMIKLYFDKNINSMLITFKKFLINNKKLFNLFNNLCIEKSNINLIINPKNIYLLIKNNNKLIILDCFLVYSLFSFPIYRDDIYYNIQDSELIFNIQKIKHFEDILNSNEKSTNYFNSLYKIYNNIYLSIYDNIKNLNINTLNINFKHNLINILYNKSILNKNRFINMSIYNIFINLNIYNKDLCNYFLKKNDTFFLSIENNLENYLKDNNDIINLHELIKTFFDNISKIKINNSNINNLKKNIGKINKLVDNFSLFKSNDFILIIKNLKKTFFLKRGLTSEISNQIDYDFSQIIFKKVIYNNNIDIITENFKKKLYEKIINNDKIINLMNNLEIELKDTIISINSIKNENNDIINMIKKKLVIFLKENNSLNFIKEIICEKIENIEIIYYIFENNEVDHLIKLIINNKSLYEEISNYYFTKNIYINYKKKLNNFNNNNNKIELNKFKISYIDKIVNKQNFNNLSNFSNFISYIKLNKNNLNKLNKNIEYKLSKYTKKNIELPKKENTKKNIELPKKENTKKNIKESTKQPNKLNELIDNIINIINKINEPPFVIAYRDSNYFYICYKSNSIVKSTIGYKIKVIFFDTYYQDLSNKIKNNFDFIFFKNFIKTKISKKSDLIVHFQCSRLVT